MGTLDRLSLQLLNALETEGEEKQCIYKKFLLDVRGSPTSEELQCPEFNDGLSWINTSAPLTMNGNLKGKVVVLDFWTYCCINCMHILPDLHALEQKYSVNDGVVVIGVHSAKFSNEKLDENITNAVHRYGISHAVVNDSDMIMWQQLGIQCWPTIVVVGPDGGLLNQYVGEGHRQELIDFVGCTLEVYEDIIDHRPLPLAVGSSVLSSSLFYPTKVLVEDDQLIISDSGHHRVVIASLDGTIKTVIGSGKSGCVDGSFSESQFITPQGLCKIAKKIYIADSDAHTIRVVDLLERTVSTLTGTGVQGNDYVGGKKGQHQVISSPWDIKHYHIPSSPADANESGEDLLLIAMAGSHQIWAYFLSQAKWWKNQVYEPETCAAVVGSGKEENRNNSYPMKAALAQPSGLSVDSVNGMCYIADSESSTVRQLNLRDGQVKGMAGGAIDPKNLFSYGDVDGKGAEAKLQHPLDVCHIPNSQHVIICDSYNHKLKLLNTKTKQVITLTATGLSEPGGLSLHEPSRTLYIADTNNHRIKRIPLPESLDAEVELLVEEVVIEPEEMADVYEPLFNHDSRPVKRVTKDMVTISPPTTSMILEHKLIPNCQLAADMASYYRVIFPPEDDGEVAKPILGVPKPLEADPSTLQMDIDLSSQSGGQFDITVELKLYFCSKADNTCRRNVFLITQPIDLYTPDSPDRPKADSAEMDKADSAEMDKADSAEMDKADSAELGE